MNHEPFEFPESPAPIYGETVAGRAAEVRSQLESLAKKSNGLDFERAVLLAESKGNRYWEEEFESFPEYAQAVAGVGKRNADYLVRIIQVSEQLGIQRSRIEHLDVSKLREIFSLNPEDFYINQETQATEPLHGHIARLLVEIDPTKTSPALTQEEVKAECKRLKGLTGENDLVQMTKAKVTADCKANVCDPAVELAKRNIGSTRRDSDGDAVEPSDGACWEVIAQSYLADINSYAEGEAPLIADNPNYDEGSEEPGE